MAAGDRDASQSFGVCPGSHSHGRDQGQAEAHHADGAAAHVLDVGVADVSHQEAGRMRGGRYRAVHQTMAGSLGVEVGDRMGRMARTSWKAHMVLLASVPAAAAAALLGLGLDHTSFLVEAAPRYVDLAEHAHNPAEHGADVQVRPQTKSSRGAPFR